MNARHAKTTANRNSCAAVSRPAASLVGILGVVLATAIVTAQDRIRIVETPRTAMRDTRSVAPPPAPRAVQPQRGDGPDRTSIVYVEHFVTEMRDHYRTVYVPIIVRQTEPTRVWWNPLGFSARSFRPRPVVRWETRVEKIRVPVRYRELVRETTELQPPTSTSDSPNGSIRTAAVGNWTSATTRSIRTATKSSPTVVLPVPQADGRSQFESNPPRYGSPPRVRGQRAIR